MKRKKNPQRTKTSGKRRVLSEGGFHRFEFHRHGMALLPSPEDKKPGVAYLIRDRPGEVGQRLCSCTTSKKQTCTHILDLAEIYKTLKKRMEGKDLDEDFRSSIWYRLAHILGGVPNRTGQTVTVRHIFHGDKRRVQVYGSDGEEIFTYLSRGPDFSRFMERCSGIPDEEAVPQRSTILKRLGLLTLTQNERAMLDRGFLTMRQALEESFWYRALYHCYREFGAVGCTFHPAIEEGSGSFTVTCKRSEQEPIFRVVVPRQMVRRLLVAFKELLPNQHNLAIHPIPLKSIFKVSMNTEMDLEVRPIIQLIQADGEEKFFEREDLKRFMYGDLIYVKELGIMAELEQPDRERKFKAPVKMILKKSQVPTFLEEFEGELRNGAYIVDAEVKALRVFKQFDRIQITAEVLERDWCWLSVKYAFGNTSLTLNEILDARKEGQRYIPTPEGWVDCEAPDVKRIAATFAGTRETNESDQIKLSRMDLFRMHATNEKPLEIAGNDERAILLKKILKLKPSKPLPKLKGMKSSLRPYQKLGVEWIMFLQENGFGGLLCDDMGLGKTHQAMAFMLFLQERKKVKSPFLVVCPTTVLSHWGNKIREHAPGLKVGDYYGSKRDLKKALKGNHVLLTSYGILLRDIEQLRLLNFSFVAFDEIQHIKNPQTLTYKAAGDIQAEMKLGLTGTPIENTLDELKALLDQTVPGYLGSDEEFHSRYVDTESANPDKAGSVGQNELRRLISPFTLRRLKKTVLKELPEKIEDIRTCSLSEDQVKLYRDAISMRGKGLLDILREEKDPVPYIHIFALLNLLKQICNHPAMMADSVEDYEQYQSGKWDLFKELLAECLDSGQKVVLYSQYLRMIQIIERHLKAQAVGFVTLTGASRNRGEIISRFNNDPDCRVYVGSLKAGGTGVDLIGGSVVIHYDRWWNAAKEDQATDRVHRIGQKRGVQVFKLVTEGTLEEKISAIIEKKRNLMDSIIREDDPELLKTFTRKELIEMLSILPVK